MRNHLHLSREALVASLVVLSASFAGCRRPEASVPAPAGRKARQATAFITAHHPGGTTTGSGFVAWVRGDEALVATNRHVVVSEGGTPASEVTVVLGSGSPNEKKVMAEIVALDPDADLALLRLKGRGFPSPIEPGDAAAPAETLPVQILGYPFGNALGAGHSPEITIGSGSISSLRRDDRGRVFALQVDADLNPGNSGGPVVTPDGKLVGIAVAKIRESGIGFAIPAAVLASMLDGRPVAVAPAELEAAPGSASFHVSVELLDPLGGVSAVEVLFAPVSAQPGAPPAGKDHRFGQLAAVANRAFLEKRKDGFEGTIDLRGVPVDTDHYVQLRYLDGRGRPLFTEPLVVTAHFSGKTESPPDGALLRASLDADGRFASTKERLAALPAPAPVETPDSYIRLPGPVDSFAVAGAGRYLVLRIPSVGALGIFDVEQGSLARLVPLPSLDFQLAAGGDVALTAFSENGLLSTWSLSTGERIASRASPFKGRVVGLAMGHANDRLAVVRFSEANGPFARVGASLLDVRTLAPQSMTEEDAKTLDAAGSNFRDEFWLATDGGLTAIAMGDRGGSGIRLLSRQGGPFRSASSWDFRALALPGDDGRLYTASGEILTRDLVPTAKLPGGLLPGAGGAFFLVAGGAGDLDVYRSGTTARIGSAGKIPEAPVATPPAELQRSPFALHQRVFFDASRMRVVFVTPDREALVLRKLDLRRMLEGLGKSYLVPISSPPISARRGTELAYRIVTLSRPVPVTCRLEFGPPGMLVSEDGLVTWSVPGISDLSAPREVTAVITVRNGAGEEAFHNLRISLD